jgi:curved DNA-binding protein CbpA
MAAKLEGANYYELLNVVPEADTASIQSAFFQLAKTWHPDRAAAAPELRSTINQIFAKLSEAHQVLSNGAKRSEYDRLRSEGGDSEEDQAQVQRVLRAATQFQKAEVLARKADWAGAEALAQKAAEADPDQPEYVALHAYLQAKSGSARGDEALAALIAALSKAHKAQPLNIRIRYYRAQVLKLAGRSTEAMRDFRAVVDQEPGNVDAQRELRLYKMRGGEAVDRAAKKSDGPGLLGRLFKK